MSRIRAFWAESPASARFAALFACYAALGCARAALADGFSVALDGVPLAMIGAAFGGIPATLCSALPDIASRLAFGSFAARTGAAGFGGALAIAAGALSGLVYGVSLGGGLFRARTAAGEPSDRRLGAFRIAATRLAVCALFQFGAGEAFARLSGGARLAEGALTRAGICAGLFYLEAAFLITLARAYAAREAPSPQRGSGEGEVPLTIPSDAASPHYHSGGALASRRSLGGALSRASASLRESAAGLRGAKSLASLAALVALQIVLKRFVTINLELDNRFGVDYVALALCGALLGPVAAMAAGGAADVMAFFMGGATSTGPYHPGFTLTAMLGGLVYGMAFYRREATLARVVAARIAVSVLLNLGLNTYWLSQLVGRAFWAMMPSRAIKAACLFYVDVSLLYPVLRRARGMLRAGR